MRALVLWAESHSANLGVRALGQGSASLRKRVWPEIEVEFQGFGPAAAPLRIGNPRTLVRHYLAPSSASVDRIRTFDLVTLLSQVLDRADLDDQVRAVRRRADALLTTAEQSLRAAG